jgi:cytochrome c oxidase subunit 2
VGPRRRFLIVAVALAGALVLPAIAAADVITPESGGSPNADSIKTLFVLILILAAIVFVGVEACLIWFLFKYRARKGRVAAQVHGNTQLEVGWTVGAAAILVFIIAFTFIKLGDIKDPAASDIDANGNPVGSTAQFAQYDLPSPPRGATLHIRVDGQQYVWRYQYPGPQVVYAYEEMVVPVGMTVTLDITSDDVAHSWWIPKLGGKFDALPGYVNKTWFKATEPGVFKGQCAELCGRNHANMLARVRAVPFPEYRAWYRQRAADIDRARKLGAEERRQQEDEGQ